LTDKRTKKYKKTQSQKNNKMKAQTEAAATTKNEEGGAEME
jgi:hypothetical protein